MLVVAFLGACLASLPENNEVDLEHAIEHGNPESSSNFFALRQFFFNTRDYGTIPSVPETSVVAEPAAVEESRCLYIGRKMSLACQRFSSYDLIQDVIFFQVISLLLFTALNLFILLNPLVHCDKDTSKQIYLSFIKSGFEVSLGNYIYRLFNDEE